MNATSVCFSARVSEVCTISDLTQQYVGWPTLGRFADDKLAVVTSGGRHHHICPFGQVQWIESVDQGQTWSLPQVLIDGPLDDRDAGFLATSKGTLLVTWFNSTAWQWMMKNKPAHKDKLTAAQWTQWQLRADRLDDELLKRERGCWVIRSTDGGRTWSRKINTVVNSPHGPTQLTDGSLLYVGKKKCSQLKDISGSPFENTMGAARSVDDGLSWQWVSEIPTRPNDENQHYNEMHAVQAASGQVIAHIRNHNTQNKHEVLQTESADNGQSWSMPHPIGVWGYPAFLTRLRDGRLLTTVSCRREPWDIRASVSSDHGQSWSDSFVIATIALKGASDFGYPSTVEMSDGRLMTAWYEMLPRHANTSLRQATWTLEG